MNKIVKKTKLFTVSLITLSLIASSGSGFLVSVNKAHAAGPIIKALSFAGKKGVVDGNNINLNLFGITDANLIEAASIEISEDSTLTIINPSDGTSIIVPSPTDGSNTLTSGTNTFSPDMMAGFIGFSGLNAATLSAASGNTFTVKGTLENVTSGVTDIAINISMVDQAKIDNDKTAAEKAEKARADKKKKDDKKRAEHRKAEKKKAAQKLAIKKVAEFKIFATPRNIAAYNTVSAIKRVNPAKFNAMALAFKKYNTVSAKVFVRPTAAINMFNSYNGYAIYLNHLSKLKK